MNAIVPGSRFELIGCLVAGAHSFSHVGLSRELAMASPELTLPMFCGELDISVPFCTTHRDNSKCTSFIQTELSLKEFLFLCDMCNSRMKVLHTCYVINVWLYVYCLSVSTCMCDSVECIHVLPGAHALLVLCI